MSTWIKNNFWNFFFGIFALIGTVFGVVSAVLTVRSDRLMAEGVRTEGRVVRMVYNDGSAAPVVEYETEWGDTRTYTSSIFSSPPSYETGEIVTLWYDPERPDRVQLAGLDRWLLPGIFGLFFAIFGGIGYGGLLVQRAKKRRRAWLQTNGTPVEAGQVEVSRNYSLKVNGVSPFVILCQWHDPAAGKVYSFVSDSIWFDPSPFVQGRATLTVLIDPRNPKIYFVDTSFLPEAGS